MPNAATPPSLVLTGILIPCTLVATTMSVFDEALPDFLPREILLSAAILGGLASIVSSALGFGSARRAHREKAHPQIIPQHEFP